MPEIKRSFGWVPQPKDKRDYIFKAPALLELPKKVDLSKYDSPIQDQGSIGSCTANAISGALQLLEIKKYKTEHPVLSFFSGIWIFIKRILLTIWNRNLYQYSGNKSRLFIYFNGRRIQGWDDTDCGCIIRDAIKSVADEGVCIEKEWPYLTWKVNQRAPESCYTSAKSHIITEYRAITTLDDMRACLASGNPFVFGFYVYRSFRMPSKDGIINLPKEGEELIGSHAVCAIGYDDDTKRFLVRNSWGTQWGNRGYFTLPYEYISDPNQASDFWTIIKEK